MQIQRNKSIHCCGCFHFFGGEGGILCAVCFFDCCMRCSKKLHCSRLRRPLAFGLRLLRRTLFSGSNPFIKRKKSTPYGCALFFGGEGGIRTLEPLLTVTRFPIVRARPATRHLQIFNFRQSTLLLYER